MCDDIVSVGVYRCDERKRRRRDVIVKFGVTGRSKSEDWFRENDSE